MKGNFATGIIAFGVLMAICYVAGSVIETVLVSILLATLLAPGVELLRRWRLPRSLGAFLMVALLLASVYLAFLLFYSRTEDFVNELPRYSRIVRNGILQIRRSAEQFQRQTEQMIPPNPERVQTVTVAEPSWFSGYLFPGFETVYNFLVTASFIPFLVFFMLTWKDHLRSRFLEAFEEERQPAIAQSLTSIAAMVRGYILANVLVGLILSVLSAILFLALGLRFPFILGFLSGFLSLIPYLGVVLAAAGPVLVAVGQFHTAGPYLILLGSLVGLHLFALNVLLPKMVGARVHLNPVAVTLAILIWGWMWGAMGLVLAIPITAAAKAVCDNVPGLVPFGKLLGE